MDAIVKIGSSVKPAGTPAASKQPATPNPVSRQADAAATTRVDISSLSARMQVAGADLGEAGAINAARVTEIKQAITEGRFSINPEKIADGLLQGVREMLKQGR